MSVTQACTPHAGENSYIDLAQACQVNVDWILKCGRGLSLGFEIFKLRFGPVIEAEAWADFEVLTKVVD